MLTFKEIGEKIKELREFKDFTIENLSNLLSDLTIEDLENIESGNKFVNAIELRNILKALNVDIDDVLDSEQDDIGLVGLLKRNGEFVIQEEETALDDLWYHMTSLIRQKALGSRVI